MMTYRAPMQHVMKRDFSVKKKYVGKNQRSNWEI